MLTRLREISVFILLTTVGCGDFSGDEKNETNTTPEQEPVQPKSGETVASYSPEFGTSVEVYDRDSPLVGSSLMIPPGALAVATNIILEPVESLMSHLGSNDLDSASPAIEVRSSAMQPILIPPTLAIVISEGGYGLVEGDDEFSRLSVVGRVGSTKEIIWIPRSKLTVQDGLAFFQITQFGAYQLVFDNRLEKTVPKDSPLTTDKTPKQVETAKVAKTD